MYNQDMWHNMSEDIWSYPPAAVHTFHVAYSVTHSVAKQPSFEWQGEVEMMLKEAVMV